MSKEKVITTSGDIIETQLAKLRELFPDIFCEGRPDLNKLKILLGESSDTGPARFFFTWAGKSEAINLLQTPSRATLVPLPEESDNFNKTGNIFIEGDNLEVLKLLFKPYFGRVKIIYIDPPYNTGQDFVYQDNYADPLSLYLENTGQSDMAGNLLVSNPETSGRYHSAWLSMLYPRLFLARQLLREDGILCVSIDDHEVHHLRMILNEIFGEENYYATIVWQKKDTPANDTKGMSVTHEYVLLFQRSEAFVRNLLPRTEDQIANYKNPDGDHRGPWTRTTLIRKEVRAERLYVVKNPKGRERTPPLGTSWRIPPETFAQYEREGRIWWGQEADGDLPFLKRFLSDVQQGVVPISWWDYEFAGSNRNAKMVIRDIFDGDAPFETPKPVQLIKRLLEVTTSVNSDDEIILDFFAGSCTTAQAVLTMNREDKGNRKFILVQLPEKTNRPDYKTIADIGKERIRRVIAKLRKESAGNKAKTESADQLTLPAEVTAEDLGFKVFRLERSNIRQWQSDRTPDPETYIQTVMEFEDPLLPGWTVENVLWELVLREGYPLDACFERIALTNGNSLHKVADQKTGQYFFVCLDEKVSADITKFCELKQEDIFICRDKALDDSAAANLALQCRLKTI